MKKIVSLFSIICLVTIPFSTFAQNVDRAQMKEKVQVEVNKQVKELTELLELSQNQIPLVENRLKEYFTTVAELNHMNMNSEDLSRRMEALNNSHIAMMDRILSPEQMNKYVKYHSEQKLK